MEHPGRLHQGPPRGEGHRLPEIEPPRRQLQRPGSRDLPLAELKKHLHTLPDQPDWIPYRTSYYSEDWGFCLSHRQLLGLEEGDYEVVIDSTLEDGSLTYGECYLPGATEDEILISVHACHPSLANDNLSGVGLATMLARHLASVERRYSYRFLFIPGTIGAITWLCLNEGKVGKIKAGLVVAGVGDSGDITYQRSRRGNAEIDRAAAHVLGRAARPGRLLDFCPWGYDERQYGSPGIRSSGRTVLQNPVRRVSGIPHVRGRPELRFGRLAGRQLPEGPGASSRCSRGTGPIGT